MLWKYTLYHSHSLRIYIEIFMDYIKLIFFPFSHRYVLFVKVFFFLLQALTVFIVLVLHNSFTDYSCNCVSWYCAYCCEWNIFIIFWLAIIISNRIDFCIFFHLGSLNWTMLLSPKFFFNDFLISISLGFVFVFVLTRKLFTIQLPCLRDTQYSYRPCPAGRFDWENPIPFY